MYVVDIEFLLHDRSSSMRNHLRCKVQSFGSHTGQNCLLSMGKCSAWKNSVNRLTTAYVALDAVEVDGFFFKA